MGNRQSYISNAHPCHTPPTLHEGMRSAEANLRLMMEMASSGSARLRQVDWGLGIADWGFKPTRWAKRRRPEVSNEANFPRLGLKNQRSREKRSQFGPTREVDWGLRIGDSSPPDGRNADGGKYQTKPISRVWASQPTIERKTKPISADTTDRLEIRDCGLGIQAHPMGGTPAAGNIKRSQFPAFGPQKPTIERKTKPIWADATGRLEIRDWGLGIQAYPMGGTPAAENIKRSQFGPAGAVPMPLFSQRRRRKHRCQTAHGTAATVCELYEKRVQIPRTFSRRAYTIS